jgi:hypothetical protein
VVVLAAAVPVVLVALVALVAPPAQLAVVVSVWLAH